MLWRALLLVCAAKCIVQETMILSPKFNDVLENSSLEMTCYAPKNAKLTTWNIMTWIGPFSILEFSKEGSCTTEGFLADKHYFETKCYSNATFKMKIKRVNISNHGQEWRCSHKLTDSNIASITVQVPTKLVTFKNMNEDVIKTVEDIKTTLTCETSEGLPAANITWTKVSKKGITKYLKNEVSTKEILTEGNLTIVRSSIDIEPEREDNGTRIICEASNSKLYVAKNEITIIVHYPAGIPYFQFVGKNDLVDNGTILTNKIALQEMSSFTVICKADGNPYPTCTWNVDTDKKSPSLTFENILKDAKGLYKCFAENVINGSFPAFEVKTNTSSDLEIDVLYQSRVIMFYIIGLEQKNIFIVTESESIIFKCSVDSNPESSISLSFKGKEIGNNSSAKALIHVHQISSCFDDGIYKCAAQNRYNSKPSFKELRLHVKCRPRASPDFNLTSTVSTSRNLTVTFDFQAIAKPMPEFEWFKLGETLWNNLSTGNKYNIQTTEFSSSLSIRSITDDDYGHYKLEIRNEVGSLEQMFNLKENNTTDEQEQVNVESSVPRIVLFVAVGTLGLAIFAAFFIFFGYRHSRQKGSENKLTKEVIENQTTTSNDDNNVIYDEIDNVYEHLDVQHKERTMYMEMQNIELDESHKDYITPII